MPPATSTPNVMISSTFDDLKDHRAALMEALHTHDLHAIDMKYHLANPAHDVIGSSLAMVAKSAAYVGLISHRYGQVIADARNPDNYSVTRLEFEDAQRRDLPTLMFIMGEDHPVLPRHVDKDPALIAKLEAYRARAKQGRIYVVFDSLDDFKLKARDAAANLRRHLDGIAAPAEATQPAQPTSTVSKPTHFLGRDALRDSLVTALLAPFPSPTIILGVAGIGKTTLTEAVATHADIAARFGTRRYFVKLDTATSAEAAETAIIRAVGLDPAQNRIAQALAELATAPALLVLDNLESPEQAQPQETEALLARLGETPALVLLASLRGATPPRRPRWASHTLPPLDDAAATALFRAIAGQIAADDPDLPRFLAALGGLPLAIELVAYRAATHATLAELWGEWQRIGTVLARRDDVAEDRQDRLSSLDHSLRLSLASSRMTQPALRLFGLLGALPAGLADQDRAILLGAEAMGARDALLALGLATHSAGRLDLLQPIRDFARRAVPSEAEDAKAWRGHFLALARDEGGKVGKDGGRAAALRLAPEVANLDAVFAAALAAGDRAAALVAQDGMFRFIRFTGLGSSAQHRALADACVAAGDPDGAGMCLFSLGTIALDRSDPTTAGARYEEAMRLYRSVGAMLGEANCIRGLGDIALRRSDLATAGARYEEALRLYRSGGAVLSEAICIRRLGDIARERSDHAAAGVHYEEALLLFRRVGDVLGEANCIRSLGEIALLRSEHAAARARYEEALKLYRRVGVVLGEANSILSLGDIALRLSDNVAAGVQYEEALPLYRLVGDLLGEANCIRGLGHVARARSDHGAALARYGEALALYRRIGDPFSIGWTFQRMALVTDGTEREGHIAAARAAWESIGREDLVAEWLDPMVGG